METVELYDLKKKKQLNKVLPGLKALKEENNIKKFQDIFIKISVISLIIKITTSFVQKKMNSSETSNMERGRTAAEIYANEKAKEKSESLKCFFIITLDKQGTKPKNFQKHLAAL